MALILYVIRAVRQVRPHEDCNDPDFARDVQAVIRVMLVGPTGLLRGALVAVLATQNDIEVIGEADSANGQLMATRQRPDIIVIDIDVFGSEALTVVRRLTTDLPRCRVIILSGQGTASALREALAVDARGFIGKNQAPTDLIRMVRQVHAGDRVVIDPTTALAALRTATNPLSSRERDVLRAIGDGLSAKEVAERLFLSHGTVRNHLSAILRKTGTRNRLDALRRAHEAGWI